MRTTSIATGLCAVVAGVLAGYAGWTQGQPPFVGALLVALGCAHVGVALTARRRQAQRAIEPRRSNDTAAGRPPRRPQLPRRSEGPHAGAARLEDLLAVTNRHVIAR